VRRVDTTVNGERRKLPDGATVAALLAELGVAPAGIAVAVNERVVRRGSFESHALREGDAVEIIRAVAGG
jgi:sulfur carrier protein